MISRIATFFFPCLILCIWIIVFGLRLIPLGGEWGELKASTWLIILAWMLVHFSTMVVGLLEISKHTAGQKIFPNSLTKLIPWVTKLSLIALIGALLIGYEFAFVRGYGFFKSVATIRAMEVSASKEGFAGSWVSGVGRLMTPALMTAWVIAVMAWKDLSKNKKCFLIFASFTVFAQQLMFEGGRFYYAALLSMILIAHKFAKVKHSIANHKVTIKKLHFGLLGMAVVIGFGYVFVNRIQESGRDFYEAYTTWSKIFDLEPSPDLESRLSGENAGFWLGITMLWAYVTQGLNELNVLVLSDMNIKAYGLFQFSQIGQVLAILFDSDLKFNRFQNLPHVGTYFTLYGASYVDFGHVGALFFSGLLGWLTGRSIKSLRMGNFDGLALNAPLLITLSLFAPVVSLIPNLWPAFFWAFFIHFFRFRLFTSRLTRKHKQQVLY